MDRKNEIRIMASLLTTMIEGKEAEAEALKCTLRTYQRQCQHEGVEIYRNYKVGTCQTCRNEFVNKRTVDEIFST